MSSRLRSSAYIILTFVNKDKSIKLGTESLANPDIGSEVIRIEAIQRYKNNFNLNCDLPLIVPFD